MLLNLHLIGRKVHLIGRKVNHQAATFKGNSKTPNSTKSLYELLCLNTNFQFGSLSTWTRHVPRNRRRARKVVHRVVGCLRGEQAPLGCLRRIWLGWGFLVVCFLYKTNPNPPKKTNPVGKSGPNATFNLIFLGLGWSWVGEFDGFTIPFVLFPIQQDLANRKPPIARGRITGAVAARPPKTLNTAWVDHLRCLKKNQGRRKPSFSSPCTSKDTRATITSGLPSDLQ